MGSGSTAFAAALRAQELGKASLMIEQRTIGGTCVNRGCLPSKNLIEAARLIHDARNPRYPGLTPVGSHDGGIVAHNALSGGDMRAVDHRVIPRAIFTDPQVASVGMTHEETIAAGHRCWCNTVPMSLVPRAGATRDTRGIVKMVADVSTDEVVGVAMVGANAAEVIHEAAMAMRFHATLEDFIDMVHVCPTMAEALKIAAISRYKDPAKLSCCAE